MNWHFEPQTEWLFNFTLTFAQRERVGEVPDGTRVISHFKGGTISGPALTGRVLSGADWILLRGAQQAIDVRMTLESEDGALLYATYRGVRHTGADPQQRDAWRFVIALSFETSAERYHAFNHMLAIGVGGLVPAVPDDAPDEPTLGYSVYRLGG